MDREYAWVERGAGTLTLLVAAIFIATLSWPSDVRAPPTSPDPVRSADPRSGRGWAMERLDLSLAYDPATGRLEIDGTMTLRLAADSSYGPTIRVNRRAPVVRFRSVSAEGAEITLGVPHPDRKNARAADVRFPVAHSRGDRISVDFQCVADRNSRQLLLAGDLAYASWVEGWYPAPLAPRRGARTGEAPGSTSLNLPADWTGVTNGVRTERTPKGDRVVERWRLDEPRMRSFIAGPYQRSTASTDLGEVAVYARSDSMRREGATVARELARVVETLEERFGPFPYPTYSVVEVPEMETWDASSEQGFLVSEADELLDTQGRLPLLGHEVSHAWWGNQVRGHGPGSILLSEGLAQYGAALAVEGILGRSEATRFLRFPWEGYYPEQNASGYFGYLRRGWDGSISSLTTGDRGVSQLTRAKGPWIFRMLRWRMGDSLFFSTLREIQADYADRAVDLDEFRSIFVEVSPDSARLPTFFDQWLDRPGAPVLGLQWSAVRTGGEAVEVVVRQWNVEPFDLKLDLGITTTDSTGVHTVHLDERLERFRLPSAGRPGSVVLDPNHRLLIWTPDYGWLSALNGKG